MDARTPLQPAIVTPKQALSIKPFGLEMRVLLTTGATGGAISVIMAWHKPEEGPPDHVHYSQEEMFFIVEGTYELTLGGQTSTVGPGTIVFIPATWCTASRMSARPQRECSTGACRVDKTTTSKRSPNSLQAAPSPARR